MNVSEGRDDSVLARLADAASTVLLDQHRDPDHNRTVLTLAGRPDTVVDAARALARTAVELIDLRRHEGVHPRVGALDVVPFVPYVSGDLPPRDLTTAAELRDKFADWLAAELDVPSFLYGPLPGGGTRSLPDLRRLAFAPPGRAASSPTPGPEAPSHGGRHGRGRPARPGGLQRVGLLPRDGTSHRAPGAHRTVRALALAVDGRAQVSCNLVDPAFFGPARLYDAVAELVERRAGRSRAPSWSG